MSNAIAWGVDTSKWQASKVNYSKLRASGATFVLLRIGCGNTKDKCFEADYASAKASGLKVGAYFYTNSTTVAQAQYDASRVLGWLNGRALDFPIAYDVEDSKQKGTSRKTTNANMYNAFAKVIEADGIYDAILYTGESFYNSYFNKNLVADDLWIAKYSAKEPSVGRDIALWQFSSSSISTDYYVGALDRNYMFKKFNGNDEVTVENTSNPYTVPTRTLKKTVPQMNGDDVKWVQYVLYKCGMLTSVSDIDGYFGNATKKAVINYQSYKGLKQDGIVGPATIYAMKRR